MASNIVAASTAKESLLKAMSNLLQDTDSTDLMVTCADQQWWVHSTILAMRSPFFKGAIVNNMLEKKEMKIEIKNTEGLQEVTPEAMQEVINFMYGISIEGKNATLGSLLEAAERFQMDDMKVDVVNIGRKSIALESALEIGKLAELYSSEQLLQESAEFIVKNNMEMTEDDLMPKLTTRVLGILRKFSPANIGECMEEVSRFKRKVLATATSVVCEKQEIIPNPGNLLNIFPELGLEFKISFDLWVEEFHYDGATVQQSVLFVQPEGEPITYSPSINTNYKGHFNISIGRRYSEDKYESPRFEEKKWIHVEVSQKKDVLGLVLFQVSLDDVTYTVSRSDPKVLQKVKVYAGDPNSKAVSGKIKNFSMVSL